MPEGEKEGREEYTELDCRRRRDHGALVGMARPCAPRGNNL
jgi:hypothetical protein